MSITVRVRVDNLAAAESRSASVTSTERLQGGEERARSVWGSVSTLIACAQAGRNGFLMELDPLSCDSNVTRFEQFTDKSVQRQAAEPC